MTLIDVMPTLLDLLGVRIPAGLAGRSLAAHLRTGVPVSREVLYAEAHSRKAATVDGFDDSWISPAFAATEWPYRLIRLRKPGGHRYELYDLERDPTEHTDLYPDDVERVAHLRDLLDTYRSRNVATRDARTRAISTQDLLPSATLDDERREKLRALGYLD